MLAVMLRPHRGWNGFQPMQDADYWKQIFEDAKHEAERLEAKIEVKNTLSVAAVVAIFFGLSVGASLFLLR
jgi:hypothetical protein